MQPVLFPRMARVKQIFPHASPIDFPRELDRQLQSVLPRIKKGGRIGVAVGSRGISNLTSVVRSVVEFVKKAGAEPFIIPAMGSHGGATPEGQADVLAHYGITEETTGAPIRPSLDVQVIGKTADGVEVNCSVEALQSDGMIIVNRIKPHTDFSGTMGSGVMKMTVIGLGKRMGAATCHAAATRLGHEHVFRTVSRVIIEKAPILCGVGLIENQRHETESIHVLPSEKIEELENKLFIKSRELMPRLPLADLDFLVIDQIGKNISGAGMDPNVIGRGVQGYSSALSDRSNDPTIRRIFVRDLTEETDGNGIGIGLADFTTSRLVSGLRKQVVFINSLTSLTPHAAKIPMHWDTDREVLQYGLGTLAMEDTRKATLVRIANTLALEQLEVSETCLPCLKNRKDIEIVSDPEEWVFDRAGNLGRLGAA